MLVAWSVRSRADRYDQLEHIAAENARAAIELDAAIEHHTGMLADHPNMGRVGRVKGTRELVVARTPFIAVYRVRADVEVKRVEILRLLHGAQQWPPPNPKM